jgi:hypothetical protein
MMKCSNGETLKPKTPKQVSRGIHLFNIQEAPKHSGKMDHSIDERIGLTVDLVYSLRIEEKNDLLLKFYFEMK